MLFPPMPHLRLRAAARTCARSLLVGMAVAACLAGSHAAAPAQTVEENLWVTNGPVYSVARGGGTIYIGGAFTRVGPPTGSGVPIDAATGGLPPSFPKVVGSVGAIAPDGTGGWYIGGLFTSVGGILRTNLAHIAADLSLSAWNPGANDEVRALAVSGATVYVGGRFTISGGQARSGIAALDATTGAATGWNPNALVGSGSPYVNVLAVSGATVYAGGSFTGIGGQARNDIAALDAATGAATAWNPNANYEVRALVVSGATVYAGGDFTSIGGQARNRMAALDAATGTATAWNPNAHVNGGFACSVNALAVSGATVYAGGDFLLIGALTRVGIAAIDATTGLATAWNPGGNGYVTALAASGGTVYAGGYFSTIGGQSRGNIAALDAATGVATTWNPDANSSVRALVVSGATVYAGGAFTSVGGVARNNIAALDAASGAATAWNPNAVGTYFPTTYYPYVYALAAVGSTIYVGGGFSGIGGQQRQRIAALDATTGLATAWNPSAAADEGYVHALAVTVSPACSSCRTVYVGGYFTNIGGQDRRCIAALDGLYGTATAWDPRALGGIGGHPSVDALAISGTTVYIGGLFSLVGGQARNNIAAVDVGGFTTAWDPNAAFGVSALAVSGSTVYAGGTFATIGGQARNCIAALDATTGMATDWNPNLVGQYPVVNALAVRGSTVYVGGAFSSVGGQARSNIAALDVASGLASAWNPAAVGTSEPTVNVLAVSGSVVYAGGGFWSIGSSGHSGFAAITDATTAAVMSTFHAESVGDGVRIVWEFSDPGGFSSVALERASASSGPWTELSAEWSQEGASTVALDRTTEAGLTYYYRLAVTYRDGAHATFGPLSVIAGGTITAFDLEGISPNPTSGKAVIEYSVPRAAEVDVAMFDLQGREVATLASGFHGVGRYQVTWSGEIESGRARPGVYFVRMLGGGVSRTRRVVVSD